jgi:hypothetical protein
MSSGRHARCLLTRHSGRFSATGYVVDQQRAVRGATVPQRVTLVSWGRELEVGLRLLLRQQRQLQVISSPAELAKGIPPADVVVVDVPAQDRRAVCEQVRRHHRGRLLVLLDREDTGHDLPPHPNQTLLTRPFFVYELAAALAGSGPAQPSPDPADQPPLVLPRTTLAHGAKCRLDRGRSVVTHAVSGLLGSWRERRLVGLSAISLCAALLVGVALVLITRGGGCGPACNQLTGAGLTAPSSTAVTTAGQDGTASSVGTVGPTTTHSSVDPTTEGRSRVEAATSSRPEIARTTAGSSGTPSSTSPPDPTQPPPTAAPTTTRPKPSTTTVTTTTTTSTTTTRPWPPDH